MDKKKLHIDEASGKHYPEPDVPVGDAWDQMQQLLLQSPTPSDSHSGSGSGSGIAKGVSKLMLSAGAGAMVIASLVIYVVTAKKDAPSSAHVTYYSERYPKIDTLADGTIAFLDTLSSIAVTNLSATKKQITINNGGCYFRQLNKNASAPWQLKIGSINILSDNANIYVSVDTAAAVAVVQLQTGSAAIQVGEEKLQMAAGESVQFNTKKELLHNRKKMDPNSFSYANRVFEFSNTSFKEAAGYIEKAYGVKIMIKGNFQHCTITTRFDNKSLQEILDILAYTLAFDYKIDEKNRQVLISGDGCN